MAENPNQRAIIQMLQDDIRGEHAAIVQYLQHVYKMAEVSETAEVACEVEEIAREEMRHYKWLSEMVVALGGIPTLERDPIFIDGAPPSGLMQLDLEAENRAIALYEAHIGAIDDPMIKALLQRILSDELAHRESFTDYIVETGGSEEPSPLEPQHGPFAESGATEEVRQAVQATTENAPFENTSSTRTVGLLNDDIAGEYTVILQYLQHSFLVPSCPISRDLMEERAQWEMKHMGWLSEEVVKLGGQPSTDHGEVVVPEAVSDMLRADIRAEQQAEAMYQRHIAEVEDSGIKKLLERIHYQEVWDEGKFEEMLSTLDREEVKQANGSLAQTEDGATPPVKPVRKLTVGSLMDKQQEGI